MQNIELRTFTEEEYHVFFREYEPDPFVDPYPFTYSPEVISRSYQYNHSGERTNYSHYGVFEDGQPVGSFQLKQIDMEMRCCEFGIILQNERIRNRGIGTEAIRLGMKEAADNFGIIRFTGKTMARNKRMQRVFEKLGFKQKDTVPGGIKMPDGTEEDLYIYEKCLTEDD